MTGIPRGYSEIDEINDITATFVAKLSINEPKNGVKYISKIQMALNTS